MHGGGRRAEADTRVDKRSWAHGLGAEATQWLGGSSPAPVGSDLGLAVPNLHPGMMDRRR